MILVDWEGDFKFLVSFFYFFLLAFEFFVDLTCAIVKVDGGRLPEGVGGVTFPLRRGVAG